MNFLSGYGSGSDDEDKHSAPINDHFSRKIDRDGFVSISIASQEQTNKDDFPKKKKIELLSFLPANIQAALQGNTMYDSDSDSDNAKGPSLKCPLVHKNDSKGSCNLVQSALLTMLPKASNDGAIDTSAHVNSTSCRISTEKKQSRQIANEINEPKIIPNSKFAMPLNPGKQETYFVGKTQVEKPRVSIKSSSTYESLVYVPQNCANPNQGAELSPGDHRIPLFTYAETPCSSVSSRSAALVVYPPARTFGRKEDRALLSNVVQCDGREAYDQMQQASKHEQHGEQFLKDSSGPESNYYHFDDAGDNSSAGSNRKRNRQMEAELLNGNINVVDKSNCAATGPMEWDQKKYVEKQKFEQQVNNAYNFGGTNGSTKLIAQPSRVQNKKHQINSLAMAAANVEMEMFDARGVRNKTKAETQAKYGW